jgi:hypothetical protein
MFYVELNIKHGSDMGVNMTSLAKRLKLLVAGITQSLEPGEGLKKEKSYHFP